MLVYSVLLCDYTDWQIGNISQSSVAMIVEVMWEVLPSSPIAAEILLQQIVRDQETQSLRQVR